MFIVEENNEILRMSKSNDDPSAKNGAIETWG